jgi:hypothetical protein
MIASTQARDETLGWLRGYETGKRGRGGVDYLLPAAGVEQPALRFTFFNSPESSAKIVS